MDKQERAVAEFDQYFSFITRTLPEGLWEYYNRLRDAGFSKRQSFQLVRDYQRILVNPDSDKE